MAQAACIETLQWSGELDGRTLCFVGFALTNQSGAVAAPKEPETQYLSISER
jgi:hypothetical protein